MRALLGAVLVLAPVGWAATVAAYLRVRRQLAVARSREQGTAATALSAITRVRNHLIEMRDNPLTDSGTAAMLELEITRLPKERA